MNSMILATSIANWLNTAFAGIDEAVAIFIHQLFQISPFMTFLMEAISFTAKSGILMIVITIALSFPQKTRRVALATLLAVAMGALITNVVLKPLVLRPRPYSFEGSVYHQFWLLVGQPTESDFSFPSGHTTAAAACSMGFFLAMVDTKKNRWWIPVVCVVYTIVMGISRIYLSVHYFTDVFVGIFAGAAGGVLGELIAKVIPDKFYQKKLFQKKSEA